MSGSADSQNCLNCGTELVGQYCGHCGQRAATRLISIFELLRDAFGDLFELDSRLWRTLVPLLIRPGLLTKDYLEGRRARYMPPFRMYLVLSVVFFVVAFFNPKDEFAILYEPVAESATETQTPDDMAEEDVDAGIAEEPEEDPASPDETSPADDDPGLDITFDDDDDSVNISFDDETGVLKSCTVGNFDMGDSPEWLKRRITPERLENVCERLKNAGMDGLREAIQSNIPAGLIVLLPLMAFVLKLLYPLSRRYYVEHLLFFVHFHAFFFLTLSLLVLLGRLGDWIAILETPSTLIIVAASLYIPIYLFISMRKVYGQGRVITFLKYVPLTISYFIGFTLIMVGAALIAVFSI